MSISLKPLKNALSQLTSALTEVTSELTRDGAIQRFEYTFELSWKTLKRYFAWNQQLDESNVKNILREAGKQVLIDNVEHWFEYHQARNLTSHLYSHPVAEEVYKLAQRFAQDAHALVLKLEKLVPPEGL
jgi:nucleotidyltransferase substrate binding protein (TIGR01987 family)